MQIARPLALLALAGLLLCHPPAAWADDGKSDGISIHLGGAHFEVSDEVTPEQVGLAVYPGAQRQDKRGDGDSGSVRVDIGSDEKRLRLLLVSFRSDAAPAALADFYRHELASHGGVKECAGTGETHGRHRSHHRGLQLHGLDALDGIDECDGSGSKGSLVLVAKEGGERLIVSLRPQASGTELVLLRLRLPKEE